MHVDLARRGQIMPRSWPEEHLEKNGGQFARIEMRIYTQRDQGGSMSTEVAVSAGWYQYDANLPRQLRYWDGVRWHDHYVAWNGSRWVRMSRPGAAKSGVPTGVWVAVAAVAAVAMPVVAVFVYIGIVAFIVIGAYVATG